MTIRKWLLPALFLLFTLGCASTGMMAPQKGGAPAGQGGSNPWVK